jgi:hypothetical protein
LQKRLDLARNWRELGIKAAMYEREIEHLVSRDMPTKSLDEPLFFDSWSEGPFTVGEVAQFVAERPDVATNFHTDGSVTYAEYLMNADDPDADLEPTAHPSDRPSKVPVLRRLFDMASSIIAGIVAGLGGWK